MQREDRTRQLKPVELSGIRDLDSLARRLPSRYRGDLYACALYLFDLGWNYGYRAVSEFDENERKVFRGFGKTVARYLRERTTREVPIDILLRTYDADTNGADDGA